jgi:hypothetical protein
MPTAASIPLTPAEISLLVELLEHERGELPAEIRRSRVTTMTEELRKRLQVIADLLNRFRSQ